MPPAAAPQTSAAIAPVSGALRTRTLAELSDDHLDHLARLVARYWLRLHRMNLALVFAPMTGCSLLMPSPLGQVLGWLVFLLLPVHVISYLMGRRFVKDEVASLGYDGATARTVLAAWTRGQRRFTPMFSTTKAQAFLLQDLAAARARARDARD